MKLTEEEKQKRLKRYAGKSLADIYPEIAAEWDCEANEDLTPQMIPGRYNGKAYFICLKGHKYQAFVSNRTQGKGCPYCSGRKAIKGINDLATLRPDIAAEWDYSKNIDTPDMVTPCSNKKYFFLCKKGHSYSASLTNRTRRKNNNCPYCSGHKVLKGFNDVATTDPEIAAEWDYSKNIYTPYEISRGSHKQIWFICNHGHSYHTQLNTRTRLGVKCKVCNMSILGQNIYNCLTKNNIVFDMEYVFDTLKRRAFDFYLIRNNVVIEADGLQHFTENTKFNTISFKELNKRDNERNRYCIDNNIYILRIPYIYNVNDIEIMILDFVKNKQIPQEIIDFYSQYDFSNYAEIAMKQNQKIENV